MRTLIVGTGIIGTIYGWALKEAGADVSHFVRSPRPDIQKDGINIDILDERKGFKKYNPCHYSPTILEKLDKEMTFDLVIVPTNWYQTEAALRELVPQLKDSFFLLMTSNWTGTAMFDEILRRDQYILGYPDGGGTVREGVYWTNIGPEIHIARATKENQRGFELVQEVFGKASIKMDVQDSMLQWLWVHNAGSTAISLAFQKYRNTEKYLSDKKLLRQSFLATRECLDLCEKRGAYSNKYPEIAAFKWPLWLLIPMFRFNFRHNESMKRYTAHGEKMPLEDIMSNYRDILQTSKDLQVEMPFFQQLGEQILNEARAGASIT